MQNLKIPSQESFTYFELQVKSTNKQTKKRLKKQAVTGKDKIIPN